MAAPAHLHCLHAGSCFALAPSFGDNELLPQFNNEFSAFPSMKKRLLKGNGAEKPGRLTGSKRPKAEHAGWLKPKSNARTRVGAAFQCTALPPYSPPSSEASACSTDTTSASAAESDCASHPGATAELTDESVTVCSAASAPATLLTALASVAADLSPCSEEEQSARTTTPISSERSQ